MIFIEILHICNKNREHYFELNRILCVCVEKYYLSKVELKRMVTSKKELSNFSMILYTVFGF